MKRLVFLFGVIFLGISSVSNAAVYRFDIEGNVHEAGYSEFDSNTHNATDDPDHVGEYQMPGGLKITASNGYRYTLGGGLMLPSFVEDADKPTENKDYFAYMDGNWKQDAGLGVCKTDTNSCGSDDNQMEGEYVHMAFDNVTEILSLDITGNHEAVADASVFWYSLDEGTSWGSFDIGGEVLGSALDIFLTLGERWITDTLDYTIEGGPNDGEMYLSAMTVNPVPVPAAFWLFGTALFGFIAFSRRVKV